MITVFTPTYNRAYIIHKLYESLCRQTFSDFEWLVVDDGSADNTAQLLSGYVEEGRIPIRYIKQPNGGKHRAINRAITEARGELFFIVDSDDYLTDNALERLWFYYDQIKDDPDFAGVGGLRIYSNGSVIGLKREFSVMDADEIDIKQYLGGDRATAHKTEVLARYPFPEYDGEKFLSEGVIWTRLAQKYKMRFFYEGIYVCEYLPDGLSFHNRVTHRESPRGSMIVYAEEARYLRSRWKRVKAAINYYRSTIGYRGSRSGEFALPWWGKLFYPVGWLFYRLDLRDEKNPKKILSRLNKC